MQTILGAGGAIGKDLAKELANYTDKIRLVGRNPQKVSPTDELFIADLLHREQVINAVEGSDVVYLTVGLPYKTKIWKISWPKVMDNVIAACKAHNSKLVFFDNMYMYNRHYLGDMDENTPVAPSSIKGKIRAEIADKVLSEVRAGNLTALIARAPDFLGTHNSVIGELVYNNFKKGKKAMWLVSTDNIRNMIYTPDAAKATAILGNTPDAYNQLWHLPSMKEKLTGKEWIELFAYKMGVKPRYSILKPAMIKILGLFVPIMREFYEMLYQYDRDYYFNSSKFENRFKFVPTTSEYAVEQIVKGNV